MHKLLPLILNCQVPIKRATERQPPAGLPLFSLWGRCNLATKSCNQNFFLETTQMMKKAAQGGAKALTDAKKKAAARAEYNRRLATGELINLKSIAYKTGVNRCTLKGWITKENWGNAPQLKRGAPTGNVNGMGNRGGAPHGNLNAFKHGGYSKRLFMEYVDAAIQWLIAYNESESS